MEGNGKNKAYSQLLNQTYSENWKWTYQKDIRCEIKVENSRVSMKIEVCFCTIGKLQKKCMYLTGNREKIIS